MSYGVFHDEELSTPETNALASASTSMFSKRGDSGQTDEPISESTDSGQTHEPSSALIERGQQKSLIGMAVLRQLLLVLKQDLETAARNSLRLESTSGGSTHLSGHVALTHMLAQMKQVDAPPSTQDAESQAEILSVLVEKSTGVDTRMASAAETDVETIQAAINLAQRATAAAMAERSQDRVAALISTDSLEAKLEEIQAEQVRLAAEAEVVWRVVRAREADRGRTVPVVGTATSNVVGKTGGLLAMHIRFTPRHD
eukprot:SAG31_NODE_319_length_17776_cov_4.703570_1_plen_257_part_00